VKTYFDTSLLLATYLPEPSTDAALSILHATPAPVPLSHLLELELRTAIRVKHGRGEASAGTMRGALQALESDLAKGLLARPDYDLETVYLRAEAISAKHAVATLARTADLWHVASALEAGCTAFASFDERQRQAAELCGLEVIPASGPAPKTGKAKR
jgi:predicted nucleic acid-binding protein